METNCRDENAHQILLTTVEDSSPLWKYRLKYYDNIKIKLGEIRYWSVAGVYLTQDNDQ
jgi:hypothetical protein